MLFAKAVGKSSKQDYVSSWMQYQSLWEINTSAVQRPAMNTQDGGVLRSLCFTRGSLATGRRSLRSTHGRCGHRIARVALEENLSRWHSRDARNDGLAARQSLPRLALRGMLTEIQILSSRFEGSEQAQQTASRCASSCERLPVARRRTSALSWWTTARLRMPVSPLSRILEFCQLSGPVQGQGKV